MTKDERLIFETEFWQVVLSSNQLYLGRCRVELKRPCKDLSSLNQNEIVDFFDIVKKLESVLKSTFGATMFNWTCLMNNAYQDDTPKPQVHWHFRPRYKNRVDFAGQTFIDTQFGGHYLRGDDDSTFASDEVLNLIKDEIKRNL